VRVERFLALAGAARADPLIVVNRCDLGDARLVELRMLGAPVVPVSALRRTHLEALALQPGETTVLLESSGAGKSTLVNALLGTDRLATGAVRERARTRPRTASSSSFRAEDS
jgi:ribosome biogenesis GTPase